MKGAMIILLLYPVLVAAYLDDLMVVVTTGQHNYYAGTDGTVHLQLFGASNVSDLLELDTHEDNFERGAMDYFYLVTRLIPDISYIKLTIGGNDGWFLRHVLLEWRSILGAPLVFECNCWVDDNGYQFAYLPIQNRSRWLVTVKTGDYNNSHTDGEVFIALSNGTYQTPPHRLNEDGYDDFERDAEDIYDLATENIGQLMFIEVTVDGSESWFLSWVRVESMETRRRYYFSCGLWFSDGTRGPDKATFNVHPAS